MARSCDKMEESQLESGYSKGEMAQVKAQENVKSLWTQVELQPVRVDKHYNGDQ